MAKKCAPGVICIENITLFLIIIFLLIGLYLWYITNIQPLKQKQAAGNAGQPSPILLPISSRQDEFNDPYQPPLKKDMYHLKDSSDVRGIPVNVETRGLPTTYQQIGILNRTNDMNNDMILPLMGRRTMSGRDQWQYYTISGSGNLNARLPISLGGKKCSGEYGCNEISNGDVVYVEGYNDTFRATIYENNTFQYIPIL
tara:strand:+ start:117 stop:713 length:597 start_codon:yes stop_codon:yes gene_type:complete